MRLLILLAFIAAAPAIAQQETGVLAGALIGRDSLGSEFPLGGRRVRFGQSDSMRTTTDATGRFMLRVPAGERTVRFGSRLFTEVEARVVVPPNDTASVTLISRMRGPLSDFVYGQEDLSWMERWDAPREMELAVHALASERDRGGGRRTELWIWANYDLFVPHRFTRLVIEEDQVRGEVIAYWPLDPYNPGLDIRLRRLEVQALCDTFAVGHHYVYREPLPEGARYCYSEADSGCRPPPSHGVTVCRMRLDEEPDWHAVLTDLERYEVWTLPDESALPPLPWVTVDGWCLLVVAFRDGRRRTYSYCNPGHEATVQHRHAHAIARTLKEVGGVSAPYEGD